MGEQLALLEVDSWREALWYGMPEFEQADARPAHSIVFHFETLADVVALEALLGFPLPRGPLKASTWYPRRDNERYADKRWVSP